MNKAKKEQQQPFKWKASDAGMLKMMFFLDHKIDPKPFAIPFAYYVMNMCRSCI